MHKSFPLRPYLHCIRVNLGLPTLPTWNLEGYALECHTPEGYGSERSTPSNIHLGGRHFRIRYCMLGHNLQNIFLDTALVYPPEVDKRRHAIWITNYTSGVPRALQPSKLSLVLLRKTLGASTPSATLEGESTSGNTAHGQDPKPGSRMVAGHARVGVRVDR